MVQVDDVDPYKLPQPDRERLTVLLSDIPPYCHVFFVFDTVAYQPDRRQKKLHGVLEGQGSAVSFEKQSEREDRKSTRLNSSHFLLSRMPSSA